MGFHVAFIPTVSSDAMPAIQFEFEPGFGYREIVMTGCYAMEEAGIGVFQIGGFGQEEWPHDVGYELSAFMEQLPALMVSLSENRTGKVDMYPQGLERTLTFRPTGEHVEIRCASRTDWVPHPEFEAMTRNELDSMLTELAQNFFIGLKAASPELANRAIQAWNEKIEVDS
ncbi:hypothetical protein ACQPW1_35335 [Nocardia sp. CA-128927]|uniref:hypothetical protein n=1 Tax=Nocardia sp. CA-128927 TaxID=3239975 RepID=UPI003D969E17